MEKFIELDNKKYILHDCVITTQNNHNYKTAFKKFNCIDGEIKQVVKDGWFSKGFILCSVYIPITDTAEKAIEDFQDFVEKKESSNTYIFWMVGATFVAIIAVIVWILLKREREEQKPTTASRIKAFFKNAYIKFKSFFSKN